MHIVRNAPMLIRGNKVHTTRVSTQLQNQLQNQPPNPQRAVCWWSSPKPPPPPSQTPTPAIGIVTQWAIRLQTSDFYGP